MQLIEHIKNYVEGVSQLRLRKTSIHDKKRTVDFVFVSLAPLSKEKEDMVRQICTLYAGNGFTVNASFEKDTLTAANIKSAIDKYIKERHPSLIGRIKGGYSVSQSQDGFSVIFEVDSLTEKIIEDMGFFNELSKYFDGISAISVVFLTKGFPLKQDGEELKLKIQQYQQLQQSRELSRPKRYTDVKNIQTYIGKEVSARARYISDITEPIQKCTAAGRISNKKTSFPDKITSAVCKFNLTDYTGTISAVLFAKKDTLKKFEALLEQEEVIVSASAQRSSFSGEIELKVYDISKCEMIKESQQTKYLNEVPQQYVTVSPQKIALEKQLALEEQSKVAPYFLRENDVVTLSLLTTGQRIFQDRIVKITATKIVKGELTQSFESYISPERVLEEDYFKRSGLKEEDLKGAPTIIDVLPDLFKFCHNCAIVAQNAEVTMGFVKYYANAAKYLFSNVLFDFEALVKNFFSQSQYSGQRLTNFSAEKVAEKLNLKIAFSSFDSESLALARVLLRMAHLYDKLFQNT